MWRLSLILAVGASAGLYGCGQSRAPSTAQQTLRKPVMGTLGRVTAEAADQAAAQAAVAAAFDAFDRVNALMSDYREDSEISQLNRAEVGEPVALSAETFACLEDAAQVAARSEGAFDVTCRPLVQLWKQAGEQNRLPDTTTLAATRAFVGWEKLVLDRVRQTATRTIAGLEVDLGGIAKGYALDLAVAAMRDAGATAGLVDLGGDMRVFGEWASGEPASIKVDHPTREGAYILRLELADRAIATSGSKWRFVEIEGERYSHIVDPRTGRPARQAPEVTVIADDGATADAWATVFSVMSVAEGRALLEDENAPQVEVLWVLPDDGALRTVMTGGFESYVVETNLDE